MKDGRGLVLDCEADILNMLDTRLVAPLWPEGDFSRPANRLNPIFEIDGKRYVMLTQFAASVETRELGPVIGSLAEHDIAIANAFDMLLTGY